MFFAFIQSVIIAIIIIMIYSFDKIYKQSILSDIEWQSIYSIFLLRNLIFTIGTPTLLDKCVGGSAIWENWKSIQIYLHDSRIKKYNILCGKIPIELFAGYHNIIISDEAKQIRIKELYRITRAIYQDIGKSICITAHDWDEFMQKIIKSMQITMGCNQEISLESYFAMVKRQHQLAHREPNHLLSSYQNENTHGE